MNQSYARVWMHRTLRSRARKLFGVQTIMHARYFRGFFLSWMQIGYGMRVVYAECMDIV